MNQFGRFFLGRILDAGYKPVRRGSETFYQKPGEKGILYDIPEATIQVIESGLMQGTSNQK